MIMIHHRDYRQGFFPLPRYKHHLRSAAEPQTQETENEAIHATILLLLAPAPSRLNPEGVSAGTASHHSKILAALESWARTSLHEVPEGISPVSRNCPFVKGG